MATFYRARQRGRLGYHALDHPQPPAPSEWFADHVRFRVGGTLEGGAPEAAFRQHLRSMQQWCRQSEGQWRFGQTQGSFSVRLARPFGTLGGLLQASFHLGLESNRVALAVAINPARTASHLLARFREIEPIQRLVDEGDAASFFAQAERPSTLSLDQNDNWIESLTLARALFGPDPLVGLVQLMERPLRALMLEVVAPRAAGFAHNIEGTALIASNRLQRVALEWSRLTVTTAEVYFERTHNDAPALLDRCLARLTASQSEGAWQSYQPDQGGERTRHGSAVSASLTGSAKQVLYAKTRDRVRCETRYIRKVRNTLGDPVLRSLLDWVIALREDAAERLRWPSIQRLIAPAPSATIEDLAELIEALRRATSPRHDLHSLFASLVLNGGVSAEALPIRLIQRLVDEQVIEDVRLQRRSRPGQPRRFTLTPRYGSVAEQVRAAFGLSL